MAGVLGAIGSLAGGIGGLVGGFSDAFGGGSDTPTLNTLPSLANILSPGIRVRNAFNRTSLEPRGQFPRISRQLLGIGGTLGGLGDSILGTRSSLVPIGAGLRGLQGDLADLQSQVAPGFGRLTEARVRAIRDARAESIGNIRESLGRRGVLGSSFAQDATARATLAFAQQEEEARAEAIIQEIGLSRQIIQDRMSNFGQQIGLAQVDADLIGKAALQYVAQSSILSQHLDRELTMVGMAANIRQGINALAQDQGFARAQLEALAQAWQSSAETAFFKNLGGTLGQIGGALEGLLNRGGGDTGLITGTQLV